MKTAGVWASGRPLQPANRRSVGDSCGPWPWALPPGCAVREPVRWRWMGGRICGFPRQWWPASLRDGPICRSIRPPRIFVRQLCLSPDLTQKYVQLCHNIISKYSNRDKHHQQNKLSHSSPPPSHRFSLCISLLYFFHLKGVLTYLLSYKENIKMDKILTMRQGSPKAMAVFHNFFIFSSPFREKLMPYFYCTAKE